MIKGEPISIEKLMSQDSRTAFEEYESNLSAEEKASLTDSELITNFAAEFLSKHLINAAILNSLFTGKGLDKH